jgi:hypothetical protein
MRGATRKIVSATQRKGSEEGLRTNGKHNRRRIWAVVVGGIMIVVASWLLYRYVAPKGWREWSWAGPSAGLHHRPLCRVVWIPADHLRADDANTNRKTIRVSGGGNFISGSNPSLFEFAIDVGGLPGLVPLARSCRSGLGLILMALSMTNSASTVAVMLKAAFPNYSCSTSLEGL